MRSIPIISQYHAPLHGTPSTRIACRTIRGKFIWKELFGFALSYTTPNHAYLDLLGANAQFKKDFNENLLRFPCSECKIGRYKDRSILIPGWHGSIDFSEPDHRKKLMIIGWDLSSAVKDQSVNVNFEINEDVYDPENKNSRFWARLAVILQDKFPSMLENVYVTDLCKCDASKFLPKPRECWRNCAKYFLTKEIELIRPELIIFLSQD